MSIHPLIKIMGLLPLIMLSSACSQYSSYDYTLPNELVTNTGDYGSQTTYYESKFPETREPTGKKTFIYDPQKLAWAAYDENGSLVKEGPGSAGRDYCPDIGQPCRTPSGKFRVFRMEGAECKSSKFPVGEGGAPMPHCMFFNGGYAIHGSYSVPNYNASHGCIRVMPDSARWLQENFVDIGTDVIVEPYDAPVTSISNTSETPTATVNVIPQENVPANTDQQFNQSINSQF